MQQDITALLNELSYCWITLTDASNRLQDAFELWAIAFDQFSQTTPKQLIRVQLLMEALEAEHEDFLETTRLTLAKGDRIFSDLNQALSDLEHEGDRLPEDSTQVNGAVVNGNGYHGSTSF